MVNAKFYYIKGASSLLRKTRKRFRIKSNLNFNLRLNLTKHNNILVIRIFDWLFRFVNSLLSVLTNKKL